MALSQSDSDDPKLTGAILQGMKMRNAKTGEVPVLIHTVSCVLPHISPLLLMNLLVIVL